MGPWNFYKQNENIILLKEAKMQKKISTQICEAWEGWTKQKNEIFLNVA